MDKSVAADGDDWGYQPGKGGMAIEAKLGMFIILILVSAFGFLVYRNVDRHQQALLGDANAPGETADPVESPEFSAIPDDVPGQPATAQELEFSDQSLAGEPLSEPDLTPSLSFAPTETDETDSDTAAVWQESTEQFPQDNEPDPFPAFDVAAVDEPAGQMTDVPQSADVDPFAAQFDDDPLDTAAPSEDPLTEWTAAPEPQLAADDVAPALDFGSDAQPTQEPAEPQLAQQEEPTESPVIRFGLEGLEDMPEELRPQRAESFDVAASDPVPDSEPQLTPQEADDEWPEFAGADAFAGQESESIAPALDFDDDPTFASTEVQRAPVEEPELDFALEDSDPTPQEEDFDAQQFDPTPEDPTLAILEEGPIALEEEPELTLTEPEVGDIDEPFDIADQREAFESLNPAATVEPEIDPIAEPEPQLQIDIADNTSDLDSDFVEAFDAPEIRPRETFDVTDMPPQSEFDAANGGAIEVEPEITSFNEFPLQDAGDDAAAQLRPVMPAGGPELSPSPSSAAPFDVNGFAYENTVVTASGEEEPYEICEVQPGDNYWRISRRMYGTSRYFSALALYNHHRVRDPKKLRPGMKILIPDATVLEEKYPELFRDSQPKERAPAGYFVQRDGTPAYRIGERDTLSEIAQKHLGRSSRWIQIYRLNRDVLSNPNRLKPGTVIILPDSATNVQMVP